MILASTSDVLTRVSINPNLAGAVSSAGAALSAASAILGNMLESDLALAEVVDYYSPDAGHYGTGKKLKLYLSRMFIDDGGVTVSYGEYTGDHTTEVYTVLDPKYYSVDRTYGYVYLHNVPTYGALSIKVSYGSGFDEEDDDNVPDWLKEAAISAAVYVMHTQVAAHNKKDVLDISPEYKRMVYVMVQKHLRSRMNCLFSEHTIVETG